MKNNSLEQRNLQIKIAPYCGPSVGDNPSQLRGMPQEHVQTVCNFYRSGLGAQVVASDPSSLLMSAELRESACEEFASIRRVLGVHLRPG